jgi:molybdopterin/thiamine biosynthesis adenylyltransferase
MARAVYAKDHRNALSWGRNRALMNDYISQLEELENQALKDPSSDLEPEKAQLAFDYESKLISLGNERQLKLYDSKVLVLGTGCLSQMVLASLAGIGIGNIRILDIPDIDLQIDSTDSTGETGHGKNDFLCNPSSSGENRLKEIETSLREIHHAYGTWLEDRYSLSSFHSEFDNRLVDEFGPHAIIDATNSPGSKKAALDYISAHPTLPLISLSSSASQAAVSCYVPTEISPGVQPLDSQSLDSSPDGLSLDAIIHNEFSGKAQGPFTSGIAAGLAVEELRRLRFRYNDDGTDENLPNGQRLIYNLYSSDRKGLGSDILQIPVDFAGKKILIAGAGALGNFVSLELALLGAGRIDIIDMDTVEDSNVSRQILLRNRVGELKSKAVAERLKEISPSSDTRWINGKIGEPDILDPDLISLYGSKYGLEYKDMENGAELITEKRLLDAGYDIIFGCFDNKYARLWLDTFATRNSIPYIDGGTNPYSGQLGVYVPGLTQPLGVQIGFRNFPEQNSCRKDPSTIIPNAIIGSAMVAESIPVLAGSLEPGRSARRFRYEGENSARLIFYNPQDGEVRL